MNLALDIYPMIESISWLSMTGDRNHPQFAFSVQFIESKEEMLTAFNSELWEDVRTHAQGELTGYLAKHHYDSYDYWNNLARQSRSLLEQAAKGKLLAALSDKNLPITLLQPILLDLNRAVLEMTFRRKFPKAPIFYERSLRVYEAGRLPCGWTASIEGWPSGSLLVF